MSEVDQSLNLSGASSVFSSNSASGSILVIDDEAGIRGSAFARGIFDKDGK